MMFTSFVSLVPNRVLAKYFTTSLTQCRAFIHVMSLKVASRRFFFHFRELSEKCVEYILKTFLVHFRESLKFS